MPALAVLFLALTAVTRFAALGDRPMHHDESLFAYFGWRLSLPADGAEPLPELLHGPLQMQILAGVFRTARWLGLPGEGGETAARLPAALCGTALLAVVLGFRRRFGNAGTALALGMLAVSPGLWYYARFCRNESLFLLVAAALTLAVARAWRARRPGPWIASACVLAAALLALKENALFLFAAGLSFAAFQALCVRGRRAPGLVIARSLARERWFWIGGVALGWLLLEIVYTNGFQLRTHFAARFAEHFAYWAGQHREHRLFGPFHYHLPILLLYEPLAAGVLALGAAGLLRRRGVCPRGAFLALATLGVFLAGTVAGGALAARRPAFMEDVLHMNASWHLGLAALAVWLTLLGAARALRRGRALRAWLIWWTGASFLQYSWAGEKAPWLTLHVAAPAILLSAELFGAWWRVSGRRFALQETAVVFVTLFLALNLIQGARLNFVHPTNPGELLVYNQTTPEAGEVAAWMREQTGAGPVVVQGTPTWPFAWYLRGERGVLLDAEERPPADASGVVCDLDYPARHLQLVGRFEFERVALRRAWKPPALHLLRPWREPVVRTPLWGAMRRALFPSGERELRRRGVLPRRAASLETLDEAQRDLYLEERERYGLAAWRTLFEYVVFRRPFGGEREALRPAFFAAGRPKSERSEQ